tara:strand:+ start:387 stop:1421 length:1035 start_codon:yes stop_codon:yes gene_type:complete
MSYSAFSEDRKSLQFPSFCNGYVLIDYSDAIASENTGLWANNGSITIQMIVTPYDVNGDSDYSLISPKTVSTWNPYFNTDQRENSAMTLFKNTNIKVTLNNVNSIRKRNPAEYSISFTLTIGGTTTTITSGTVITSSPVVREVYVDPSKYLFNGHQPYAEAANEDGSYVTISSVTPADNTFVTSNDDAFAEGMRVYDENNNDLGTVQNINTVTKVITVQNIGTSFSTAFTPIRKDSLYVEVPHHIAVSYDSVNNNMCIIYNNNIVAKSKHGAGGKFILDSSDIYLGQDPSGTAQEKRKSQFFGEYHEISISSVPITRFTNLNTLSPAFKKLLLYLDFEESNLNG